MPRVVSVINYKGGVGKTTLTANIGSELANRGRQVLLVDLDPQASLTFSFFTAGEWEDEFQDEHTILQWLGPLLAGENPPPLKEYILAPDRVNEIVEPNGGRLHLVSSHLGLIDADHDLAAELGGSRAQVRSPNFLRVHRMLADALADKAFDDYDVVLIDCPPNFGMTTRAGIVASDFILIPARPDYLSTLGINYLRGRLNELITDYNKVAERANPPVSPIAPEILGVVVTMIQYAGPDPINVHKTGIQGLKDMEIAMFQQSVRQSNSLFGEDLDRTGLPVVLSKAGNAAVQYELQQLASEFYARTRT
jgi:chromosome partitioning protein